MLLPSLKFRLGFLPQGYVGFINPLEEATAKVTKTFQPVQLCLQSCAFALDGIQNFLSLTAERTSEEPSPHDPFFGVKHFTALGALRLWAIT
jgi:hypothetical protein